MKDKHPSARRITLTTSISLAAGLQLCCEAAIRELKLSPPADGSDAVPILRDAIEKCRAEDIHRLVLEPGTWNLHPEKADGEFRHVTNHDPGYRRMGIHLDGFSDFEIDGQGSTLMCHGVIMPLVVDRSKNITIRNVVFDWDTIFHLEGSVVAVGDDFFEVEMLPECEADLRNGKLMGGMAEGFFGEESNPKEARQDIRWNYWIDPTTKAAASVQPILKLWNPKTHSFAETTEVSTNRFRIRNAHINALPTLGSVMVCKGMHRQNRLSPAIHFSSVDGARVENTTIHRAGGMGLIAEDCSDVTVKGLKVALREGSKSLVTTTADATHFMGCRGTVRVENCLFENMLDDSCNVHGVYAIVEELLAPDQLAISFSHFQQLGTVFARPGDCLRLLKRDTLLGYAECSVSSVVRHNDDYYVLTLDKSLVDVLQPNSSIENLTARPDVVFRNNTVRNNRARGMLVTAGGKVLIENNLFERPSMMGILIEGDNDFWYESGAVEDVTIQSNRFVGLSTRAPLFKIGPMLPGETRVLPPYHRNIRILDNLIEAASPVVIDAKRVGGLEFCGNNVRLPTNPENPSAATFVLNACDGTVFRGNKFDHPASIQTKPPGIPVVLEENENLSIK
ncbi:MAG: right-handed parallel beta-helix repeat-containing protein [Kiritimatiellales bacterium]|nr:right-handed parallel beta-helix repeat-containing protein [Kiritimatiellales bacterium]MCF7864270.1 right-handed parallel beta-helix repeat-containing protein [Kiritimatiellales bacterium]